LQYPKRINMLNQYSDLDLLRTPITKSNGSTKNGTVRNGEFLAAIKNRLYLCNAFEIQVQNLEY